MTSSTERKNTSYATIMMPLPITQPVRKKHKRKKVIDELIDNPKKPHKLIRKGMILRCSQCHSIGYNTCTCPKKVKLEK